MKIKSSITILLIISLILLSLAIFFALPYNYYIFLRWIIFLTSICIMIKSYDLEKIKWIVMISAFAILFNPLIPFHFSKSIWKIIDIATGIVFITIIFLITENKKNHLIYENRALEYLELARSPYSLHPEKNKQKLIREFMRHVETTPFLASSSFYFLSKAISNFTIAIKLNPVCLICYFNRAYCYLLKKEFQKAIDGLTKMIELNPNDTDIVTVYFHRGCAFGDMGKLEQAINDFKKAIELDAENADVYQDCIEQLEKELKT